MLSSAKLLPHGRGPAPRVRFLFSAAVWEDEDAGLGPREECVTPHRFGDLLSLLNMPATLEEKTNVLRTPGSRPTSRVPWSSDWRSRIC